ncbi:MAG: mismatch-specific DNA-glycosylase [Vicinamibacteraceae bacterium]
MGRRVPTQRRLVRNSRTPQRLPPLQDRLDSPLDILFVGINPGIRSALTGHHFAGYSNRFWKLLFDAALVPRPVTYIDDHVLPQWRLGITNLASRPTRGIGDLRPSEYAHGRQALLTKIEHTRPRVVALVGVTLARALCDETRPATHGTLRLGLQPWRLASAPVFVLSNPSGRNAHYSYPQMLASFRALRRYSTHRPR